MRLFRALLDLLLPPRATARLVEDTRTTDLDIRLSPASFSQGDVEASGLLPYRDPLVRAFVLEAKFHRNDHALSVLADLLADHLVERAADETAFGGSITLVPIPLGVTRRRKRGYNQVEEICRKALARLGANVTLMPDALARVRETRPQTDLSGNARRINMQGAFTARTDLPRSHIYVVVDDVMTTGATLHAAVSALRASGLKNVSAIALAH